MNGGKNSDNIVWLDMEMTGLDPDTCHILEIASFVTDKNLNQISSLFHVVVNQPASILNEINDWCKEHHKKSGLIKESQRSKVNIKEAEDRYLSYLKKYTPPGCCPLAGSTVYMDRLFIMKHLPTVAEHLHYRIIDVSSVNELLRRWYPDFRVKYKERKHRAVSDIKQSFLELKYLRRKYFRYNKKTEESDPCTSKVNQQKPHKLQQEYESYEEDFYNGLFGT